MSTHNICFYGEVRKIIPELSPSTPYHLAVWVKTLADDILKYLLLFFFPEIGSDISCNSLQRDNLHKMSNPFFWGKKKRKKKIINLSSAELSKRVVKVIALWSILF